MWIERQLTELGWQPVDFARKATLSQSHVSRVLSGQVNPGLDFYRGVARAFGVPLVVVFRLDEVLPSDGSEPLPEALAIDERLRAFSPERRASALRSIDDVLRIFENLPRQ